MAKEETGSELSENKETSIAPHAKGELTDQQSSDLNLVSDDSLLGIYGEVLGKLRGNLDQQEDLLQNFAESVVNGGDSSTSSKEALVNLAKLKVDTIDKMTKIADLMTRIKLRQPDTFKPYMNKGSNGSNTINIYDQGGINKRALLESIHKGKDGK